VERGKRERRGGWRQWGAEEEEDSRWREGNKRLAQVGISILGVCTGLFVLVMVLRSRHGVRLDQDRPDREALIPYMLYTVYFSGVWCIGWVLWMHHCKHNAEASIKPEECGVNIPCNATGLAQVLVLMINTYSFVGFSFAPSIHWTTTQSSVSPVSIFVPVMQWYSNYVSAIELVLHPPPLLELTSFYVCTVVCVDVLAHHGLLLARNCCSRAVQWLCS
jgi:hypothetical protein